MRFAPPGLESPINQALHVGFQATPLGATVDSDLHLTKYEGARTGSLQITTVRSVQYLGGYQQRNGSAETYAGIRGSVFREGGLIEMTGEGDALNAGGFFKAFPHDYHPDVYLQNMRVIGVTGSQEGQHSDVFQLQRSLGNLCIDKLTFETDYQGLFLSPQLTDYGTHVSGHIYLSRINGRFTNDLNPTSYAVWLFDDQKQYDHTRHNVYVDDVWIEPHTGQSLVNCIWCAGDTGVIDVDEVGEFLYFPDHLRILSAFGGPGKFRMGPRPSGDFVQVGDVGVGYVSPGYQCEPL